MDQPLVTTTDVIKQVVVKHASGRTLDVGAGNAKYRSIITQATSSYMTCDVNPGTGVDSVQDIHCLTFEDDSFDTIMAFQVFEHLRAPRDAAAEIHRCLKPGGKAIITAPFLVPQHADPGDYQRYTVAGLSELFLASGFEIVDTGRVGALFTVLGEMVKFMWLDPYAAKPHGRLRTKFFGGLARLLYGLDRLQLSKNTDVYANVWLVARKKR